MKKYWNVSFFSLILVVACKPSPRQQDIIELKESLSVIVDSFTRNNPDKKVYELYIDKTDPHNGVLTLYAGNCPLIESENLYYNQKSNTYTLSNDKKVNVYSGLERYIKNSKLEESSVEHQNCLDKVFWVVRDSFSVFKVYENYESVYPFMPIVFDCPQFVAPEL